MEPPRFLKCLRDEIGRDAMIDDDQEADILEGMIESARDLTRAVQTDA